MIGMLITIHAGGAFIVALMLIAGAFCVGFNIGSNDK